MKNKMMLTLIAASAILAASPVMVSAATQVPDGGSWQLNSTGWWYQNADGTYPKDGTYTINGKDWGFDTNGYLAKGGWTGYDYNWHYYNTDGTAVTGWVWYNGNWYYIDDGDAVKDRYTVGDKTYFFDEKTGAMVSNVAVGGNWFGPDGALVEKPGDGWGRSYNGGWEYFWNGQAVKGWIQSGSDWYYVPDGDYDIYTNGALNINGKTYVFGTDGRMISGWSYTSDIWNNTGSGWLYANSDGTAYTGWLYSGGKWYYINNSYMISDSIISKKNGEYSIANNYDADETYYVGKDGAMITGWYHDSYSSSSYSHNNWRYAAPDGKITAGWVYSGGKWYVVNQDGYMLSSRVVSVKLDENGKVVVNGGYYGTTSYNNYVLNSNGEWVSDGWVAIKDSDGTTWLYAKNGHAYDGWLMSGGKWYYIDNGTMVTNSYVQGGYFVGTDGVWAK